MQKLETALQENWLTLWFNNWCLAQKEKTVV